MPRSVKTIDHNLTVICDHRARAIMARDSAMAEIQKLDAQVMRNEADIATCETRIQELLDERNLAETAMV